jgi:hypothetical protein
MNENVFLVCHVSCATNLGSYLVPSIRQTNARPGSTVLTPNSSINMTLAQSSRVQFWKEVAYRRRRSRCRVIKNSLSAATICRKPEKNLKLIFKNFYKLIQKSLRRRFNVLFDAFVSLGFEAIRGSFLKTSRGAHGFSVATTRSTWSSSSVVMFDPIGRHLF